MQAKVMLLVVLGVFGLITVAPAREPQGQPPGAVQSSPDKPPKKKENLTYEDRKAWQEILKWPEHCGPDPEDLRLPGEATPRTLSGLRFWQLEPKKYLVEVKCQVGPVNDIQLYLIYDENTAPPTSRVLRFERYDQVAKTIQAESDIELPGYAEFHPRKKELTLWSRARGLGDCGMWFKYRITKDRAVLLEVRGKGEYNEIIQKPATYPLMFRRHKPGVWK